MNEPTFLDHHISVARSGLDANAFALTVYGRHAPDGAPIMIDRTIIRKLAEFAGFEVTLPEPKPEVRIIDAGYELVTVYRGFHIGYTKGKGFAAYKGGETFSHRFEPHVYMVQNMIDRDINQIFSNWFDRLNECLVELGMEPETDRRARSADFFHNRTPEEVAERKKKANRYTVEQQADGTWAIFNRGGFVRGGWKSYDRDKAVEAVCELINEDRRAGVPVLPMVETVE